MSAEIPSSMPLSDLLKPTGYNCPSALQGKTFDEATSGGDAKISTNTAATIDVSTYTEPVEIEPAEGYDATKKATITLDNIPSGADIEANKAATIDVSTYTEPVEIEPTAGKDGMAKTTVTLTNIPSGGSDIPSVMQLSTYNNDAIVLFGDKAKLTRLFTPSVSDIGGWIDDISQITDSILGENAMLFESGTLTANLPSLCIEYDNKMYKAPASVSSNYEKYNFVEVQTQATPPTSDTPSGTVASGTTIHLSTTETGGTIYYSDGDSLFSEYDDSYGIEIAYDTTIKAVVAVAGKFTSEYLTLEFTVE